MEESREEDADIKYFLVVADLVCQEADYRRSQEYTKRQNAVQKGHVQVTEMKLKRMLKRCEIPQPDTDVFHVDSKVGKDSEGCSSKAEECHLEGYELPVDHPLLLLSYLSQEQVSQVQLYCGL